MAKDRERLEATNLQLEWQSAKLHKNKKEWLGFKRTETGDEQQTNETKLFQFG